MCKLNHHGPSLKNSRTFFINSFRFVVRYSSRQANLEFSLCESQILREIKFGNFIYSGG